MCVGVFSSASAIKKSNVVKKKKAKINKKNIYYNKFTPFGGSDSTMET